MLEVRAFTPITATVLLRKLKPERFMSSTVSSLQDIAPLEMPVSLLTLFPVWIAPWKRRFMELPRLNLAAASR